ncbi:MAG: ABC transporter ATP-binding protein [Ignavibacteriales bacterium]|nr:MAG: ABC transporter ATP-binding protein [Ignavibacteriales bacterium]
MAIIETNSLSKTFTSTFGKKTVNALNEFTLAIEPGTIFGLLGPNGAGKTTLVKILLGITFPTSGTAAMFGSPLNNYQIKKKIGYLPENHKYPPYLTGGEVLNFFGKLSGLDGIHLSKKIDELLEIMQLGKWKKIKVKTYSKGMMQRLGLAQAMLNDPDLIFLDEPTDGVDPIGRKEIRDILIDLKNKNKTIFLNSHLLSEVELITDRVGILNKGKLLKEGTVKELTEKKEEYKLELASSIADENPFARFSLAKITDVSYTVRVNSDEELNHLIDQLRNSNLMIKEIVKQKTTLEDMFISLIKEADKGVKS